MRPAFRGGLLFLWQIMRYQYFLLCFTITVAISSCIAPPHNLPSVIFLQKPVIVPYKKYDFKTSKAIAVIIDGCPYEIPKGFKTDLSSIPRPLWSIYSPRYAPFIGPGILHDYLYRCSEKHSRKFADKVYYSALVENGVSKLTAWKFYITVRTSGWYFFNKDC